MADGRRSVFSQADVHDLATWLFWLRVQSVGVAACKEEVLESQGISLLISENLGFVRQADVNRQVGECLTNLDQARLLTSAAADEAYRYCSNDMNLNGMVYADEALSGRDMFARRFPYPDLPASPSGIDVVGANLPKMGQLLVRSPLPASVTVQTDKVPPLFWVANTVAALNKAYPVLFMTTGIARMRQNLWCVHGYCYIPVPSPDWGNRLSRVIPNAMFSVKQHRFGNDDELIDITYDWL